MFCSSAKENDLVQGSSGLQPQISAVLARSTPHTTTTVIVPPHFWNI